MPAYLKRFLRSGLRFLSRLAPELFPRRSELNRLMQAFQRSYGESLILAGELETYDVIIEGLHQQLSQQRSLVDLRNRQVSLLANEVVAKNREIETLSDENLKLSESAMIDPLTGLYNRRGADHELDRALSAFERQDHDASQRPVVHQLSILAMDLDNFKLVNDAFGHAAGDQVLAVVAGHLKQAFRADDIIVRPGGDEFTVYLVNATKNGAISRAGHLITLMNADKQLHFDGTTVSISIGISHGSFSTKRGGLQIVKEVEALADAAMYRAKSTDGVPYCITVAEDAVNSDTVLGDL